MNRSVLLALTLVPFLLTACGARSAPRASPSARQPTLAASPTRTSVPASYQKLYDFLKTLLDQAEARLDQAGTEKYPMVFAAELITANSNRGTDLLRPETLPATILLLDRFQAMGIRGVKLSVQYPLLTPNFPNRDQYIEFYKQVMNELRKRNFVVTIQQSVLFAGTNYTTLPIRYTGLTFDRFKSENRQMTQTIIEQLHPDYLTVVGEPDTAANLTGLQALNDPAKSAEYAQAVLQDLNRGATKLGAGVGTWSPTAFIERYVSDTSIDVIALHVYPVDAHSLANAVAMARLAQAAGKRVILDESWLYKTAEAGGGSNVAASETIFKRDVYSFWQPLDQQFIRVMVKLCDVMRCDFYSVFWSPLLFGYLDYAPAFEQMSYPAVRQRANRQAFKHIQAGTLSATGVYYQTLIANHK